VSSGLLFVIGVDLLARAIKNLDHINGLIVIIGNNEVKTTTYGDHITVFLRDTQSISQ